MRELEKGDRVEIFNCGSDSGMKGVVTSVKLPYCKVKINQAGPSHSTVKNIGKTITFKVTNVRII